jgi:hypothetical protein
LSSSGAAYNASAFGGNATGNYLIAIADLSEANSYY